ncbi:hypothetical protein BaRGS_00029799, partial [Batillaria attramentaria]
SDSSQFAKQAHTSITTASRLSGAVKADDDLFRPVSVETVCAGNPLERNYRKWRTGGMHTAP